MFIFQSLTSVDAYFPFDIWYDFFTGTRLTKVGSTIELAAPQNDTNIHIRGGSIIVTQTPAKNTSYRLVLDVNHTFSGL